MRFSIRSSTSKVKVRTVPWISQLSGTTLVASPVWIMVTEITPASTGFLLRVMMVWKACTIWQATGTGSMPLCGMAACPPLPRITMWNSLLDAITGPVLAANEPTGSPGQLCMPYTTSMGNCLNRPSLIISRAPPPPFFGRLEDEVHRAVEVAVLGEVLRSGEQHGGVAVVAAGVHLARVLAGVGKGVVLLHGQGIDVGAQADGPAALAAIAAVHDAHHPGGAQPPVNGNAPFGELVRHHVGGAHLFEAQLGVGMDVPAHGGDAGGLRQDGIDQFHGVLGGSDEGLHQNDAHPSRHPNHRNDPTPATRATTLSPAS